MKFELLIENTGKIQIPAVIDGVTWATERCGTAGKLIFKVIKDETLNIEEGNPVRFTVDGKNLFYGFIFTKKHDNNRQIEITAFDQLRYLMNKDAYVYANKTAGDVIQMIADDFKLKTGEIENTSFKIPFRAEMDKTILDIIYNALDLELENKKKKFVLYDNFGKLTLKSLENMKIGLIIDEETGENFEYSSSIDEQTYNKIKLSFENENSGKRDIFIAQDGKHINDWGVLQYFGTLKQGENGAAKSAALLDLYNSKTRKLKIKKAFGDTRVRAGNLIIVNLSIGDLRVKNYMLVEKCVHVFGENEHFMDLNLRGGEFVG